MNDIMLVQVQHALARGEHPAQLLIAAQVAGAGVATQARIERAVRAVLC